MREIPLFILLSMLFVHCFSESPMKPILSGRLVHQKLMSTLVAYTCGEGPDIDKDDVFFENNQLDTDSTLKERKGDTCSDSISFLPINDKKVQVFVTANSNHGKMTTGDTSKDRKIKKIELSIKKPGVTSEVKVLTCEHDGTEWKVKMETLFKEFDHVLVDERLVKEDASDGIVQCQSFVLKEKAGPTVITDINKFEWILSVTLEQDGSVPPTKIYKGKLQMAENAKQPQYKPDYNLFDKKRCDPDKLTLSAKQSVAGIDYANLEKTATRKTDEDVPVYVKNDLNKFDQQDVFLKSKVLCPYSLTSKVNSVSEKLKSVEGTVSVECENRNDVWKYVARDARTTSNIVKEFDIADNIELECALHHCTECQQPSGTAACFGDYCSQIRHTVGEFDQCSVLPISTCASGIMRFNDGNFEKYDKVDVPCTTEKKYVMNGIEIKKATCASKFGIIESEMSHKPKNDSVALGAVDPQQAAQCDQGCACKQTNGRRELAIANSEMTDWLRIKTMTFDDQTGDWTYTREHKNGGIKTHVLAKAKNGEDRPFACVLYSVDHRTEAQKDALRKNPSKNIVIVVNLVLLVVLIGATIPTVIFYVNSQIKKREAKKAAKKDKKKEEQSGEKKDGDTKKDEEKKNEA